MITRPGADLVGRDRRRETPAGEDERGDHCEADPQRLRSPSGRYRQRACMIDQYRNSRDLDDDAEGDERGDDVEERGDRPPADDGGDAVRRLRLRMNRDAPGEQRVKDGEQHGAGDFEPRGRARGEPALAEVDLQVDAAREPGRDAGRDSDREGHLDDFVQGRDAAMHRPAHQNVGHGDTGDGQHARHAQQRDETRQLVDLPDAARETARVLRRRDRVDRLDAGPHARFLRFCDTLAEGHRWCNQFRANHILVGPIDRMVQRRLAFVKT